MPKPFLFTPRPLAFPEDLDNFFFNDNNFPQDLFGVCRDHFYLRESHFYLRRDLNNLCGNPNLKSISINLYF